MSNLRRLPLMGRPCFITSVTYERLPILVAHADLRWQAFGAVDGHMPSQLVAWVVLPDHIHVLLDVVNGGVSPFMQRVKMSFAALWRKRMNLGSGRAWQHRFWDHVIRDQDDLNQHLDYIHYNPVKHGLVASPFEWPHSSIHRYSEQGFYPPDWGRQEIAFGAGSFGE